MLILAKLIGIVITGVGIVFLANPKSIKQCMVYFREGKRLYLAGVLRLLFAAILLLAASQCRLVGVVAVFGILFLIGGVLIFVLGLERCKDIIKKWQEKPIATLRLLSLIPIIIGILLLYSI